MEVGLTAFAKRTYAPALGRWASPDPLAVHAPGEADLNLYAYVHGRVYAATDPLGLELACAAIGTCPAPSVPSAATVKSFVTTGAKVGLGVAICTQYAGFCVGAAAYRLVTEGVDDDAAAKVLAEEAPNLAGVRFTRRGKPGTPSQAIVEKDLAAPAAAVAPFADAAGGIPRIAAGTNREMLGQAVNHLKGMGRSAAELAAAFENMAGQISQLSRGSWKAARGVGTEGSHVFLGSAGEALVISPQGQLFRGSLQAGGVRVAGPGTFELDFSLLRGL